MEERWINELPASGAKLGHEWNEYLSRLVDIDDAGSQEPDPQSEAYENVPAMDMPPAA